MGYYHQDERDMAIAAGCCIISFSILLLLCLIVTLCASGCVAEKKPSTSEMDGSTAGANAVTLEELEAQNAT